MTLEKIYAEVSLNEKNKIVKYVAFQITNDKYIL